MQSAAESAALAPKTLPDTDLVRLLNSVEVHEGTSRRQIRQILWRPRKRRGMSDNLRDCADGVVGIVIGVSILAGLVRRITEGHSGSLNPLMRNSAMRFMMLVIPKAYETATADFVPPVDLVAKMTKYNDSLSKAGVLLGLDGLAPPAKAVRVAFSEGKPQVKDGPFAEAKEMVGGFWTIQVKSRDEAVEWAKRAPMLAGDIIEVRQITEMEDFPADVQAAARG